jgi:hypothetical protein
MSNHLDSHGLKLFIAHKLAPDELLRAATHIGVCQSCRDRMSHAERTGVRIENLRTELRRNVKPVEQHLDYEQLEAYVDDTLDAVGREIAGNHLAICPPCAREAQELESFRDELTHPNNASKTVASLPAEQHLWQRFRDSLRMSPRIAWAAVALLITIAAAGLLWQRGKAPEVANNNSSNAPKVVNNNNRDTTVVVSNGNRNQPEVVNNRSVNVNANASGGDSSNRRDSNRRNTAGPDSSVNPSVGVALYAAVIKRALETQRIDRAPVLMELAGKPSTLMGRSEALTFNLLQPVGTVTLSTRPVFNWQPLAGATSYRVYVLDTDFKVVAESGPVTATSWSSPTALDRGVVYLWQVSAMKEGEVISAPAAPRPEARFKILTGSKTREVQQAVKARAGSHLALGIIFAHTGLLDDAEREFQNALSRTQEAAMARKLLQNLSALRR